MNCLLSDSTPAITTWCHLYKAIVIQRGKKAQPHTKYKAATELTILLLLLSGTEAVICILYYAMVIIMMIIMVK